MATNYAKKTQYEHKHINKDAIALYLWHIQLIQHIEVQNIHLIFIIILFNFRLDSIRFGVFVEFNWKF